MTNKLNDAENLSTDDLVDFTKWFNISAVINIKFTTKAAALEFMTKWGQTLIEMEDEDVVVLSSNISMKDPMKYEKGVDNASEE